MPNKQQISGLFNIESSIFRIGILCTSIAIVLILHFIADSQHMTRRIYVYYPAYLTFYFFTIFLLFTNHLRSPEALIGKLWKCIGYGMIYGFLAGIVGYFFGIAMDIFDAKKQSLFFTHLSQNPIEYITVILIYPMVVLKSWLYGGLVGLSMFFLFRFFRVRSAF